MSQGGPGQPLMPQDAFCSFLGFYDYQIVTTMILAMKQLLQIFQEVSLGLYLVLADAKLIGELKGNKE